jgi:hypothetical protein
MLEKIQYYLSVADAAIKKLADAKKANIEKHEAEYAKACKDAETSSTKLEEDKKKAIEAAKEKKEKHSRNKSGAMTANYRHYMLVAFFMNNGAKRSHIKKFQ